MIEIKLSRALNSSNGLMKLDFKFDLDRGDFLTIYGNSGAGKTSILRMIAGLMSVDEGKIVVDNKTWLDTGSKLNLPTQKRRIGFLFQEYALFPNMTVRGNLEFALGRNGDKKAIDELIEIIELGELQNQKPDLLSGGQKQRVALARALVQQPDLLLLDEPLSALDIEVKQKLQNHLLEVHKAYNLTTIMVSHDIPEISKLSNRVVKLDVGRVIAEGSPEVLFGGQDLSGKFQFTGSIIKIEQQDIIYVISVQIGQNTVKVVADSSEVSELSLGDQVVLASKAFNPIIKKIN